MALIQLNYLDWTLLLSGLSAGLDIPALIQGYNETTVGGEPWKLHQLSQTAGPEACVGCGACAKLCPQRIDIPAVMKQYRKLREQGL